MFGGVLRSTAACYVAKKSIILPTDYNPNLRNANEKENFVVVVWLVPIYYHRVKIVITLLANINTAYKYIRHSG